MSSLTEKVLMIGFGATICLSLFSLITPLLNNVQTASRDLNNNRDVLYFYEMITEIKRKSEETIHFPSQDFRIHYDFSNATEIQFSISSISTIQIVMEREHQVFVEVIDFDRSIKFWDESTGLEIIFYHFTRTEETNGPIKVTFAIAQYSSLYFVF